MSAILFQPQCDMCFLIALQLDSQLPLTSWWGFLMTNFSAFSANWAPKSSGPVFPCIVLDLRSKVLVNEGRGYLCNISSHWLTHWVQETHIFVTIFGHYWFRQSLVICLVSSHYLILCWLIVNWTTRNNLQHIIYIIYNDICSGQCIWKYPLTLQ